MHEVFAASLCCVLALIQHVPISFKFNGTSRKMLSLCQCEGAHVYHYMKDQSVSCRDSSQPFFFHPVTHTVWQSLHQQLKKRQSHKQRYIIYHHDRHPQLFLTLKFAVETLTRTVTVTLHYCKLV